MPVLVTESDFSAQVVAVRAFTMDNGAELAFVDQFFDHQFESIVAAIFQHHTLPSRLFRRLHQVETILQLIRAAYFHTDVFARFHRFYGDRNVHFPSGKNHHRFDLDLGNIGREKAKAR